MIEMEASATESSCDGVFVSAEEIVRQRCYELGPNCKGYQKKQGTLVHFILFNRFK